MQNVLEQFHYQILGKDDSPKCVFLHGILGQGKNWRTIAKRFSHNFQCLIYDQRGHGHSFQPPSGYDPMTMAEDLKKILDALNWGPKIYLVGHSMGGRVALLFAYKYPKMLEKLVIVDIGPTSTRGAMDYILKQIDFVPTPFSSREEAKAFFAGPFLEKFGNKMTADFFYSNIEEKKMGVFDWVFHKSGIRQGLQESRVGDYWSYFHGLSVPTLLIRGARSTDLSPEDFAQVVTNNPHIEGIEVAGAGHWVHAEQPGETIKILQRFFAVAASPS